jgi:hypothetical protein
MYMYMYMYVFCWRFNGGSRVGDCFLVLICGMCRLIPFSVGLEQCPLPSDAPDPCAASVQCLLFNFELINPPGTNPSRLYRSFNVL